MKKNIAAWFRRVAQWLDPQKTEITGYARKVVGFVPYFGIDKYRDLMMAGDEEKARIIKLRMRNHAEISALADLEDNLRRRSILKLEHNFGTTARNVDGIICPAEGVTVIMELKGSWS